MSQNNPKAFVPGDTGAEHVTRHNDTADTLLSQSKGASAPTYAVAGTLWLDDSATPWVLYIYDGTHWIKISEINATADTHLVNDSDKLDGFHAGNASGNVPVSNGTVNTNLNAQLHNGLKKKVVEIGDWDMDADSTVLVTHGLAISDIRQVTAMIRKDDNGSYYPLGSRDDEGAGRIDFIGPAHIQLSRLTGGLFDDVLFDATSFNRGWIVIEYV